jgi:hypothetical protein
MAVGILGYRAGTENRQLPLVDRWDGTAWSIQPAPDPGPNLQGLTLESVSCPSATACVAVGQAQTRGTKQNPGYSVPLAERWDGTGWTVDHSDARLARVSCTSATWCVAVGSSVVSWNGVSWTKESPPLLPSWLAGVSCTAGNTCTIVGDRFAERFS